MVEERRKKMKEKRRRRRKKKWEEKHLETKGVRREVGGAGA
jgi:hypothetical protein